MKKFLSVILTVIILAMSVFSLNAFAAEAPKTEALLDRLDTATEFSVTLRAGQTNLFGFLPATITNTIAVKGNNIAYEYSAGVIKARIVTADDGIYGFMPTLPFFYVKMDVNPIKNTDIWALIKGGADLTQLLTQYVGSSEETVDGTKYYVEEYNDREFVTSKFYYVGDELKMLVVTDSSTGSVQNTYFDEITFKVADSVFEIPSSAFNLTPILQGIFLSLIAG